MRYIFSILAVIIFVVVVIVLVVTHHPATVTKPINLTDYNNSNSSVSLIVSGQLVGNTQRQAIEITARQYNVSIYILSGYNQAVAASMTYPSNSAAYGSFLGFLENNGFADSRHTNETNMFGICPLGDTYQYQLVEGFSTVSNLWGTSCANADGDFNGNGALINYLFTLQIPPTDYSNLTKNLTTIAPIASPSSGSSTPLL